MLEIVFSETFMKICLFFGQFCLSLPILTMPFLRACEDYTAYTTQAAQFLFGQRDYAKIVSANGRIFYPAIHLYHYLINLKLHLYTDKAQSIVSVTHLVFHSIISYCIASIAYRYYTRDKGKAQLICFIILSNYEISKLYHLAYNDCLFIFYLSLALYFFLVR